MYSLVGGGGYVEGVHGMAVIGMGSVLPTKRSDDGSSACNPRSKSIDSDDDQAEHDSLDIIKSRVKSITKKPSLTRETTYDDRCDCIQNHVLTV